MSILEHNTLHPTGWDSSGLDAGVSAYHPPEFVLGRSGTNIKFDSWSLGCLILDLVASYLGGSRYLEEFRNARVNEQSTLAQAGLFLKVVEKEDEEANEIDIALVKDSVKEFMEKLLKLVKIRMLVIATEDRTLERISNKSLAFIFGEFNMLSDYGPNQEAHVRDVDDKKDLMVAVDNDDAPEIEITIQETPETEIHTEETHIPGVDNQDAKAPSVGVSKDENLNAGVEDESDNSSDIESKCLSVFSYRSVSWDYDVYYSLAIRELADFFQQDNELAPILGVAIANFTSSADIARDSKNDNKDVGIVESNETNSDDSESLEDPPTALGEAKEFQNSSQAIMILRTEIRQWLQIKDMEQSHNDEVRKAASVPGTGQGSSSNAPKQGIHNGNKPPPKDNTESARPALVPNGELNATKPVLFLTRDCSRNSIARALDPGINDEMTIKNLRATYNLLYGWYKWKQPCEFKFFRFKSYRHAQDMSLHFVSVENDSERYPGTELLDYFSHPKACGNSKELQDMLPVRLGGSITEQHIISFGIHVIEEYSVLALFAPVILIEVVTIAASLWFI
ncbi:hypothetical protein PG988_016156 [Apiospora saccharicola]